MYFETWNKRQLLRRVAAVVLVHTVLTSCATWGVAAWYWKMGREAAAQANASTIPCEEAVPVMAMLEMVILPPEEETEDTHPPKKEAPSTPETQTPTPTQDKSLRVEVIRATHQPETAAKRILIYHTHTWEAFQQNTAAPYKETEKWRTRDNSCNMVAVGETLTSALIALGYQVVHDTTAFEPPNLSSSYQRSLTMLEERQKNGEQYDLYIDLHRDAYASSQAIRRTVTIGGETLARIMVLVGKGDGYAQHPDWEANKRIADKLTAAMNDQVPDLCRDVKVKTGRFNQHIAPRCVLIECGCNYNTLAEVKRSMPYLAQAIHVTLGEQE